MPGAFDVCRCWRTGFKLGDDQPDPFEIQGDDQTKGLKTSFPALWSPFSNYLVLAFIAGGVLHHVAARL